MLIKKFLMLIGLLCVSFSYGAGLPHVGDSPKLIITDLNGESFDLSQKHGKWVLVHFFATWCPACKTELPILAQIYKEYHSKGLEIIALTPEGIKSKSEVKKFIDPYHFPSALLLDSKINDFGSGIVLPMTYLLNRSGVIHKIYLPTKKVLTLKEIETDLGF